MTTLSRYIRNSFAGAAAAIALVSGIAAADEAPAPAKPKMEFAPQLHKTCIPFEGAANRPPQKYDEGLTILVDQLKSYSGWEEIRTRMKTADIHLDGICPSTRIEGSVAPIPQLRGFGINIIDAETGSSIDPKKLTTFARDGDLDDISQNIMTTTNTMPLVYGNTPLFAKDMDLKSVVMLETVMRSYTLADSMMMAAEASAEQNRSNMIEDFYAKLPGMVNIISDMHAQAIAAKKQSRDLTTEERTAFRNKIVSLAMQDPTMRAQVAQSVASRVEDYIVVKMADDYDNKRPMTPPAFRTYSQQELIERLKAFPGKLSELDAVKNYNSYWESHQDMDFLPRAEQYVKDVPARVTEKIREAEKEYNQMQLQKGVPPLLRPQQ